jgi:uncharacterized protein (TIGR02145 family)
MKNNKKILSLIILILSLLLIWIFCTEPTEPDYKASFGENKQIQTEGNPNAGSLFKMFISATGTGTITYKWYKDNSEIANSNSDTLTINSLSQTDNGVYKCVASNDYGSDTSNTYTLIVRTPPVIVNNPQSLSKVEGSSARFTVYATGTAPLTYQWQKGTDDISGETDTAYTISSVALSDSGSQFRCIVSNSYGKDTSDVAILSVTKDVIAPTITTQPQLQSITEGQIATFSVVATGTAPLSYQWQKDTVDISGATDFSYTTPATSLSDSGSLFRCIVSNSAGSDTSDNAMLIVNTNPVAPTITTQPTEQSVTEGQTATFTITATGTTPLTYQWQKDSVDISGATDLSYTTPATTMSDSGSLFRCIVSNSEGADTSDNALLKVNQDIVAPSITTHPVLQSVMEGQTATFSVRAAGTAPLTYQWQENDTNISVATDSNYTTPATILSDSGSLFRCIVSNSAGADTSEKALLQVSQKPIAPTITTQPEQQSVTEGGTATFSIVATGTAPLSYQWQQDSADITGATDSSYTTSATTLADSGSVFRCIVSNTAGADTSDNALLIVNSAPVKPTITTEPKSDTALEGETATFTVVATGTSPLSYQWQKGGTDISGGTNASYTTTAVTKTDNGAVYRCIVSNSEGADTSDNAILTVHWAPEITTQPASQTVDAGNLVTLSVTADGNPSLIYQWKKDNVAINGENGDTYQIPSVQASHAGNYTVDVMNIVDTITSNIAVLTVQTAPTITIHPKDSTVIAGNPVSFSVVASGNPSPKYQWQKDGVDISGQTNSTYVIASVQASHAGAYSVEVRNVIDTIPSNAAILTVHTAPVITTQPKDSTVIKGNPVSFSVVATGNPAPSYQWKKDGNNVGTNSNLYSISSVAVADAGTYTVVVSNTAGNVTSTPAQLYVQYKPIVIITSGPTIAYYDETVTLSVSVDANPAPNYEWKKDGVLLPSNTNSHTITNARPSTHSGTYTVKVSNSVGDTTVTVSVLTVRMEIKDVRDDQIYKIVQIGTQLWMAENLNFEINDQVDSWCYNNNSSLCDQFGRLYKWTIAMSDQGNGNDICPNGWHVPTLDEWSALKTFVGTDGGNKLKSTNSIYFNGEGTDTYGFNGLGSGFYSSFSDSFRDLYLETHFWTSYAPTSEMASMNTLRGGETEISLISGPQIDGSCVRCMKDE